jgi:hypothetical protein
MENTFSLDDAVAILGNTPKCLASLLGGLPSVWVTATEGDNTWSPYDVIGHLIYGERVNWIPRAQHILSKELRPFEPFDRTAQFSQSKGKSLSELLAEFSALRQSNLVTLSAMSLTPEILQKTGRHPEFGVVTLEQLFATWVVHDLDHIGQIVRTMAKVYSSAVGPWNAFLSILKPRS